jgi:flagellin
MSLSLNNSGFYSIVNNLTKIATQLEMSNLRLATGKKILSASDDPAGVIAAENLKSSIAQIDAATQNGERINSIIDTADGAMAQISSLLGTIQTNALAAAGSTVTAEERAAYQAEIDEAVDAIDTLVNTTTFNNTRLLDGGIGYTTSGIDTTELADVRVNSANTSSGSISMQVDVVSAAEKAVISYSNGNLTDDVTFSITGNNGTEELSFSTGATISNIETAVNAVSDATGIVAEVDGADLYFRSENYGSSQSVSINVTDGTFVMDGSTTSDTGVDATVTVNCQSATSDGLNVYFSSGSTSVRFVLKESFGNVGGGSSTFSITGGGSGWQLDANPINKIHCGLSSLDSSYLGNDSVGYLSSLKSGGSNSLASGNYNQAANIAAAASSQVATDRARIGAIQSYTVNASLSSLAAAKTAKSNALSSIEDIDYATETANNNRLQLLMQLGTSVIAAMNQNMSSILSLLK